MYSNADEFRPVEIDDHYQPPTGSPPATFTMSANPDARTEANPDQFWAPSGS
jgi:hypothetical protein